MELPDWPVALAHTYALLDNEAATANAALLADPASDGKISAAVRARLEAGAAVSAQQAQGSARVPAGLASATGRPA